VHVVDTTPPASEKPAQLLTHALQQTSSTSGI
jgi:hypothetical protein